MHPLTAAADRDLILRVLYEEYFRVHPSTRLRHRWVMDAEMLRFVRELRDSWDTPLLFAPMEPTMPLLLLGLPVEIRDGAEGIHLEVAA